MLYLVAYIVAQSLSFHFEMVMLSRLSAVCANSKRNRSPVLFAFSNAA